MSRTWRLVPWMRLPPCVAPAACRAWSRPAAVRRAAPAASHQSRHHPHAQVRQRDFHCHRHQRRHRHAAVAQHAVVAACTDHPTRRHPGPQCHAQPRSLAAAAAVAAAAVGEVRAHAAAALGVLVQADEHGRRQAAGQQGAWHRQRRGRRRARHQMAPSCTGPPAPGERRQVQRTAAQRCRAGRRGRTQCIGVWCTPCRRRVHTRQPSCVLARCPLPSKNPPCARAARRRARSTAHTTRRCRHPPPPLPRARSAVATPHAGTRRRCRRRRRRVHPHRHPRDHDHPAPPRPQRRHHGRREAAVLVRRRQRGSHQRRCAAAAASRNRWACHRWPPRRRRGWRVTHPTARRGRPAGRWRGCSAGSPCWRPVTARRRLVPAAAAWRRRAAGPGSTWGTA